MYYNQFYYCCAAAEIGDLGPGQPNAATRLLENEGYARSSDNSAAFITLATRQLKVWGPILQKAGYKRLFVFKSNETRAGRVYLYGKKLR